MHVPYVLTVNNHTFCVHSIYIYFVCVKECRSQWPRGLRRGTAAARLLRSWVRIPSAAWMFVCCECCVLSGRVLSDELITRPEESYRLCCGRRPLTCWDLGFDSHQGHGYLSVVSVVCCQVEFSATSWSLFQRSPTECAASLCVI
jgi:hypothetical protein